MNRKDKRETDLRSNNIIMDVREAVIGATRQNEPVKLSAYYRLVNSDRAVERIQDAVRMLIEARKNPKMYTQIAVRRESLSSAFEDSIRWVSDTAPFASTDAAAKAVDEAILVSITKRNIQQMAYGSLESGRG